MDSEKQIDELVLQYLLNELTEEERSKVLNWMEQSEENRQYLYKQEKLLKLIDIKQTVHKIDIEQEWKQLSASVGLNDAADDITMDPVEEEAASNKKTIVRRIWIATAAAASVILIIGLIWQFSENRNAVVDTENAIPGETAFSWRSEANNTAESKMLKLPDGSVIVLSPGSSIRYPEPFAANKRDIQLTGEANFDVVKDESKPFTVFSGELSTTALGTQFTVTAYQAEPKITIKLFTGKVVIKAVAEANGKLNKDFYLIPGQQLVYNKGATVAKVSFFAATKREAQGKKNASDNRSGGSYSSGSSTDNTAWYMFNNQSLSVVFEQLKEMYQADIVYSKKDVSKIYFIGRFNKSDSIEVVLRQIAAVNGLKLTKRDSKFVITK